MTFKSAACRAAFRRMPCRSIHPIGAARIHPLWNRPEVRCLPWHSGAQRARSRGWLEVRQRAWLDGSYIHAAHIPCARGWSGAVGITSAAEAWGLAAVRGSDCRRRPTALEVHSPGPSNFGWAFWADPCVRPADASSSAAPSDATTGSATAEKRDSPPRIAVLRFYDTRFHEHMYTYNDVKYVPRTDVLAQRIIAQIEGVVDIASFGQLGQSPRAVRVSVSAVVVKKLWRDRLAFRPADLVSVERGICTIGWHFSRPDPFDFVSLEQNNYSLRA